MALLEHQVCLCELKNYYVPYQVDYTHNISVYIMEVLFFKRNLINCIFELFVSVHVIAT